MKLQFLEETEASRLLARDPRCALNDSISPILDMDSTIQQTSFVLCPFVCPPRQAFQHNKAPDICWLRCSSWHPPINKDPITPWFAAIAWMSPVNLAIPLVLAPDFELWYPFAQFDLKLVQKKECHYPMNCSITSSNALPALPVSSLGSVVLAQHKEEP